MMDIKTLKQFKYWDIVLTVVGVFIFYQLLGVVLGTSHPVDVVVSKSMLPDMKPGDLIVCMKGKPKINDVVIYSGIRKYPIIHRVIGINDSYCRGTNPWKIKIENGTCYTVKGDNNRMRDPPVTEGQIMCVVKAKIPYLGYPRYLIFKVFGI
ncbi:MAG TPA: signal peptidase I [Candidatus Aenigmarchaeota archaeon]|nr:signal peptidase I [Candidatus Aenigmarchaeota archaeon]